MIDKANENSVRLDKWLWAARFFKTRQLAVKAIKNSRVQLNGQGAKPSSMVRAGDFVNVKRPPFVVSVEVHEISDKRGSATIAQSLYLETSDSIEQREKLNAALAAQPKTRYEQRKPDKHAIRQSRTIKRRS